MLGDRRVSGVRRVTSCAIIAGVMASVACGGDEAGRQNTAATAENTAASRAARAARSAQRCDATDASVVIDSAGIGPVLLGTRVSSLEARCTVTDTSVVLGGVQERGHIVTVGNHRLLALSIDAADTSIVRVITSDAAFKTPGGVGAGSSVEALRLAHGPLCAARSEGTFVVTAGNLPGVTFAIDWNPPPSRDPSPSETPFPGGDPGTSLDAARITRVWVHGVAGGCRVGVG